jgi:signal transduction histidine kinase
MTAPDSYDALAASIERALRTDLAPPGSATQLAGAIDRVMLGEATAGELRLGYLRVLVAVPFVALTALPLLAGRATVHDGTALVPLLLATLWLAASTVLVAALRRGWYRRWVTRAAPLVDAFFILTTLVATWQLPPGMRAPHAEMMAAATALCTFLSLSGTLRWSRRAARTATALAMGVFVIVAVVMRMEWFPVALISVILLASGLLSMSVTTLVRRLVTDEVARATLSRMYEDAEASIDAREQVLKIVSHDLRNPLHTISMCASLLLELPMPPEKQADHLTRIKRAGERMNRLVQDLLDVAKLEAGRVAISTRPVSVAPLVSEASGMLSPIAAEKQLRLETVVADGLQQVVADEGRVIQVLSNLVGNAVKFTPAGGTITIRAEDAPGGVRFSVSDTGVGMTPEQLSKLFGEFWQANPADRRGIGLGLSIAKGIVEAHGGRIWVESQPGVGTTFHFTLSASLASSGAMSGVRERRQPSGSPAEIERRTSSAATATATRQRTTQ